jgi:endonuclease G
MKQWISGLVFGLAAVTAGSAFAGQSECPQFHPGGLAPVFSNPKLGQNTRELCFQGFDVMHSGVTRTPLWSAEYLTREHVQMAKEETRSNDFHPEPRLPEDERSELSDFKREKLDRGHMTPAGDQATDSAMEESFSLANMVPQDSKLNRGRWSRIEAYTRKIALNEGAEYVVTGPLFQGQQLRVLKGRVVVPSSVFKLDYIPSKERAFVFVAENDDAGNVTIMSVAQFEQISGLSFPGIPVQVKNQQPPHVEIQ